MDIAKILSKLRITSLNEMQQHAAEAILGSDGDVVLLSPTGTGKTLAYMLPLACLVEKLSPTPLDHKSDSTSDEAADIRALVVTPSRELAQQSDQVLKSMGCGLRGMACYGGRSTMEEHRMLRDASPHIVFGTPGRLNDHIGKGNIDRYQIRYLVIDEFDKCLEMGFQTEMQKLIKELPGLERRVLLSATNAIQIPQFVNMSKKGTLIDFISDADNQPDRVRLFAVYSPQKDKLDTLRQLLLSLGDESSIVFLNYRESVERTNAYLEQQGFITSHLHGGMEQRQREDMLYKFANASTNILVATDLASRGLDIPHIQNIIHYHLPESEEGYIHRVGRTARWDATGRAFFILSAGEQLPAYITDKPEIFLPSPASQHPVSPRMSTLYIGKGKKDKLSKGDIVGFLCKKGQIASGDIGNIVVKERYTYVAVRRDKMQQVLQFTRGEKIKGIKTVIEPVK